MDTEQDGWFGRLGPQMLRGVYARRPPPPHKMATVRLYLNVDWTGWLVVDQEHSDRISPHSLPCNLEGRCSCGVACTARVSVSLLGMAWPAVYTS